MSSNTNTNNPYRGATGSGLTSGAGEHGGDRDNTHDGYGGSNTFSDRRGMDTTNSESYGRSDSRVTKSGMGAGGDTYGGRNTFNDHHGVDMSGSESYGRSDPQFTKPGAGAGNETTHARRAEQLNATTNQQYGYPTGSAYYDPSRINTSASSATGGMPGSGAELRNATAATGSNVGQGIHARGYYETGSGTGMPTSGSRTGMGDTRNVSGHHGQTSSHHSHAQHHHESHIDKEHCAMCNMVDERTKQMGSMGQTTTSTTSRTVPQSGTSAGTTTQHTSTNMPSSASRTTGLNEKGETVVHEGPSPMHLRPGETVVEYETRVHRGLAPGEKPDTRKTSNSGMGMGDGGRTAMGATTAGMGHGTAMGASTGLAGGVGGAGAGAAAGGAGGAAKGVSMTDKMMGEAEKMAGKVTSNEDMMRRGEEKLAGTTAATKN